ncbi:hypothetical protein KEM48_004231 [Puccinia striiformis f. sp. tritici PST-130]|nr:hypothetical protein KEM48_004231 [Puccinia striiformis f. sp. tritici PST-130]
MPPKEPIKAVTNKRTRSTKTSAKAATEPANGKTPAIQKGLLSPEEAQMIERLGTGTEEPEETEREQVRVVNKPQGNAGLSKPDSYLKPSSHSTQSSTSSNPLHPLVSLLSGSLKFKKVSKTTWTDEDIARVIEKYLAADKIGDKETSDTFYAVELLKSELELGRK